MQVVKSAETFGQDHRLIIKILCGSISLKLILLLVLAWNTRFVMDEFGQLGFAKYLSNGFFETVWPAKAVGYAAFYKLAHLAGWDAQSILLIGRMQTALLACATIAIVYACARALGENRVRALAIVLVLLCFSNFMERIFRTIAEPLAVFFAAASLFVIVRGEALTARRVLVAGIVSGLSFLATQKAVYFNVALGLALVADAAVARRYVAGIWRGTWLVLGWLVPIIAYCLIFGGLNPLPIAESIVFGPIEVATLGGGEYGGLRHFVGQTLKRNLVLYVFCFAGIVLSLTQVKLLDAPRRIALIFSVVITLLVFSHDQPWPYVFIMALPFVSLWSLVLLDQLATNRLHLRLGWAVMITAMAISYVSNLLYLRVDNAAQLELVSRAEAMLAQDELYFDGIGMLPNRREPSTLWLDRHYVLKTLREGKHSEAYRNLSQSPPKAILWSYRLDAVYPVIRPLFQGSYVQVAPNLRIAGHRLYRGEPANFDVPLAGRYRLYSETGMPSSCRIKIDGRVLDPPFDLAIGPKTVMLQSCPVEALILLEGSYAGLFKAGSDNAELFADVYR